MNLSKDHETIRKQLWAEAWIKTASSNSCLTTRVATDWADVCLREFDERFPSDAKDD